MIKSLVIIKPGFGELTDSVIEEFSNVGFNISNRLTTTITKEEADIIWKDLKNICEEDIPPQDKEYYSEYCEYIMSDNVTCFVIESNSCSFLNVMMIKKALREKYHVSGFRDLLHTSDTNEEAEEEISCIYG